MINLNGQADTVRRNMMNIRRTMGNNGVRLFKVKNFNAQGFINDGVEKWQPKKKKDGRKTLVGKSRMLRGTINYVTNGTEIWFRSLASYARVHNEGLRSGRGKGFMMPKREFMGDSNTLRKMNQKSILQIIKKLLR